MKDSYMIFVLAAILITPFLPQLLKGKCPGCGKRKLESLDESESRDNLEEKAGRFISSFLCKACGRQYRRERSGPLELVAESGVADVVQV